MRGVPPMREPAISRTRPLEMPGHFEDIYKGSETALMRQLGLVLVALLGLVVIASPWLDPTRVIVGTVSGEPFASGRPASYWRAQLRGGPAEKAGALSALKSADAVPVLRSLLH